MKLIGREGTRNGIIFKVNFYAFISLWIPPSSLRVSCDCLDNKAANNIVETRPLILSGPGLANLTHKRTTQVVKDSPEGRTFLYIFCIESAGGLNSL